MAGMVAALVLSALNVMPATSAYCSTGLTVVISPDAALNCDYYADTFSVCGASSFTMQATQQAQLKLDDGAAAGPTFDSVVYEKGKHGFETFRIPSLVRASNGNVIALAEGRVRVAGPQVSCDSSGGKPGWQPAGNNTCCYGKLASDYDGMCFDKDVVSKVSTDGGKTWGSFAMLSNGSNSSHFYTNAIGLVDPKTDRVWAMYSVCAVSGAYRACDDLWSSSSDHGSTWQQHPELAPYGRGMGMSGVGSGIVLAAGRNKGRLIFAQGHLIYSDDNGATWVKGASTGGSSEQQCVETAADIIVCASRSGWSPEITISHDGGETFSTRYQLDGTNGSSNVTTDNCALSMIGVGSTLLLSHPNRPDIHVLRPQPIGRQNVTVSTTTVSSTGVPRAGSWRDSVQIFEGPSAYTSLQALDADGDTCGVLYERSEISEGLPVHFDSIHIATFPCRPPARH
jgi:sialidase-1